MYAIIESGGFQFKVSLGDIVTLPKLSGKNGDRVSFSKILFFKDGEHIEAGKPYLDNVNVAGELVEAFKGKKVVYFRYQRRENYERKKGFRPELCKVRITEMGISTKS